MDCHGFLSREKLNLVMKIQDKEIPNLQKRYRVKKDGIETDCVCEFDREGFCTEGASLSNKKRNIYGYDIDGFDECGFDQDGVHRDTGTRFDKYGFNKKGIHMDTGTRFDKEGKMKSDYYNVKEKIEEPKLYKRPIEPNGINPRLSKKTFELRFFESYVNSIIKGECTEEEIIINVAKKNKKMVHEVKNEIRANLSMALSLYKICPEYAKQQETIEMMATIANAPAEKLRNTLFKNIPNLNETLTQDIEDLGARIKKLEQAYSVSHSRDEFDKGTSELEDLKRRRDVLRKIRDKGREEI